MTLGDDLPDVKPYFPFGTARPGEPAQRWSTTASQPQQGAGKSSGALSWLLDTNLSLKRSYEEACAEYAPSLRRRGRSVGEQLMEMFSSPAQTAPGSVKAQDPEDEAAPLDPVIDPLLDPFLEGLQQPFQDAYETARNQVVAGTIAAGVAGLLGGFLIGRYVGRGDGRAR